ncbi:MAG: hypothetical protein HYR56_32555 [Acidobacteria bacterium]|nr:hypothetical protein [Acidobacteriota bacterium]MBI3425064.1 hypothetical protein [Acidobacteriota bacterium]
MLSTRKITPGQKGAKRLHEQYGERLYCMRYRYDHQLRKRYKTVELIVEETAWTPPPPRYTPATLVGVRVEFAEAELQRQVKQAGGKWNPARKLWELRYDQACKLRLKSRIQKPVVSDNTNR